MCAPSPFVPTCAAAAVTLAIERLGSAQPRQEVTARGGADIAIVSVPARDVAATLAACAAKGVKGAVVFSSGFGEVGAEGRALQDEIARIARETGVGVVGCRPGYPSSVGRSHY